MISEFIDWIINRIESNLNVSCTSPTLTIETGKASCVTITGGTTEDGLCGSELYTDVNFRILTRGLNNRDSLELAEEIKSLLNNTYNEVLTNYTIANINGNNPIYVDEDDLNQIYYNIDFTMNIGR